MAKEDQPTDAGREAYLQSLFNAAVKGNVEAGDELSKIALGGFERAQELVREMDRAWSQRKLGQNPPGVEPQPRQNKQPQAKNPRGFMRSKKLLFVITHPLAALKTKARQVAVSIEHEQPPHTSTFEEFPELHVDEAAKALRRAFEEEKARRQI